MEVETTAISDCRDSEIKFFQKFKLFREIRRFLTSVRSLIRWNVHCKKALEHTEGLMLENVKTPHKKFYVDIGNCVGNNDKIWTLAMNNEIDHKSHVPMVLLHGYASALAFWLLNLDAYAHERPVYAVDLLGFGRSSRPNFSNDPNEIEEQYVMFLEKWRESMKLDKIIILAHSFGAWVASLYALKYPDRVEHLILADSWGYTPSIISQHSFLRRAFLRLFSKIPPFTLVRVFGPLGTLFLRTTRRDIVGKFESAMPDRHKYAIAKYIYHCNSIRNTATGEIAFHRLLSDGPWPVNPLIDRMIENLHIDIPLTFIYGAKSWLDYSYGALIRDSRPNSYTHIEVITSAGHKVFSDDEVLFNSIVVNACKVLKSYNRI